MKSKGALALLVVIIVAIGLFASAYVVDETEQVVVTRFGKVVGSPKQSPGLKFKIPGIDQANYFPKNLLLWDGDPGQIPTKDKTYIWVDSFARWKITDPVKFFQTVNNVDSARGRLDDIIDPAVRNAITSVPLIETVRISNRQLDTFETGLQGAEDDKGYRATATVEVGREKITQEILKHAQPKLNKFGVKLVDVKIKRINYVEKVRESVYSRMIAERKQIAEKFRSQGKGEARKILGDKEKDLKEITSKAYRTAQEIKGKAEAEATRLYAESFGRDPEFYSFLKTLEVYEEAIDKDSTLVLSTDSEFLKYFKGYSE
ncbi:MAG: protease modulator HflC [Desulfobacterales bacterium]|nr:protease modulator HflC [Desulfobacterales bacterium]